MLIAHLPAGYVLTKLMLPFAHQRAVLARFFILAGMAGAIATDLDMLYFHLIDHRQHHHHTYFTHFPIVWLALLIGSLAWLLCPRRRCLAACAAIFSGNGFFHLCLDTIVGDIWWLAPWGKEPFSLFTVPALYQPWWLSFLLHWSFGLALGIVFWAVWWRRNTPRWPTHSSAPSRS